MASLGVVSVGNGRSGASAGVCSVQSEACPDAQATVGEELTGNGGGELTGFGEDKGARGYPIIFSQYLRYLSANFYSQITTPGCGSIWGLLAVLDVPIWNCILIEGWKVTTVKVRPG